MLVFSDLRQIPLDVWYDWRAWPTPSFEGMVAVPRWYI